MKCDDVIHAFREFLKGNREEAVRAIKRIEACERSNGKTTIAAQLERLVDNYSCGTLMQVEGAPKELCLTTPTRTLDSVIVSAEIMDSVSEVVREWKHREELSKADLPPTNILLLRGASGNGKTSLAQALAAAVDLPFGLVAYNEVVDSHMGDTSKHLSKVMDFAAHTPCVVFFDEADAIVTKRSSSDGEAASRERNLTVNQLLIKLDGLGTQSMVIFATNRDSELDPAMLRRVRKTLALEAPGPKERQRMYALCFKRWPMLEPFWEQEAESATSFAGIEAVAMQAARRVVLSACV